MTQPKSEFLKCILRLRGPRKKEKHSPVGRRPLQLPAQLIFNVSLDAQRRIKKLGFGLGQDLTIIGV
jgi:hypothetical protein